MHQAAPLLASRAGAPVIEIAWMSRIDDQQLATMTRVYARHGGLFSSDTVARLMRQSTEQPISRLAHWMVERTVVQIGWRAQTLLPLFQFVPHEMTLRPQVAQIVRELSDAYDDWDVAWWFANSNVFLDGALPVDVLERDAQAVLNAARADRFIAIG
ncbi:MAG TPA: hypothetical protein VN680_12885 [Burkholderiaceae bacterium]|jgi:hypothetical protein|nr:hypothetical protein [Burkholderiaceae bacterium]